MIPGGGIASQIVVRLGARQKRVRGRRIRGTIPELVWQSSGMRRCVGPTRGKIMVAGCRNGRVARLVLSAQAGGPYPTGDGSPAAGEDGPEEQQGEPGSGPPVEGRGEAREPLARGEERMRGCHGWLRPGRSAGVVTAIVPVGPALVYLPLVSVQYAESRGKYRGYAKNPYSWRNRSLQRNWKSASRTVRASWENPSPPTRLVP